MAKKRYEKPKIKKVELKTSEAVLATWGEGERVTKDYGLKNRRTNG